MFENAWMSVEPACLKQLEYTKGIKFKVDDQKAIELASLVNEQALLHGQYLFEQGMSIAIYTITAYLYLLEFKMYLLQGTLFIGA